MDAGILDLLMGSSLVALVAAGCWLDVRSRRIPNWLTMAGLMVAFALRSFGGVELLATGVLTAAAVLIVGLPLFASGGFGGGDVKFLVAVSAFLAPLQLLEVLIFGAIGGAVIAIIVAVRHGVVIPLLLDAGQLTLSLATFGRLGERRTLQAANSASAAIPYGVAIGIGALAAWFT